MLCYYIYNLVQSPQLPQEELIPLGVNISDKMPKHITVIELSDFLKRNFPNRLEITKEELRDKIINDLKVVSIPAINCRIKAMEVWQLIKKTTPNVYNILHEYKQ